jgi:hypothetical protein
MLRATVRNGRRAFTACLARLFLLLTAAVATTGCLSTTTVVKVGPDGSGTIEVTSLLRKTGLAQFDTLAATASDHAKPTKLNDWLPESAVRSAADRLGTDVRYVSSRIIETADALGRMTVFEFADVRRLTLEPIPVLPAGGYFGADAKLDGEHRFTFDLLDAPDNTRVLIARLPEARIEYSGLGVKAERLERPDPTEEALTRTLLGGLRLEVIVQPELPIIRANTLHRDGQRVTLVSIDAERLLFDDEVSKRLLLEPGSLDELRYRLHDRPGVTVSLDREVRIELAPR